MLVFLFWSSMLFFSFFSAIAAEELMPLVDNRLEITKLINIATEEKHRACVDLTFLFDEHLPSDEKLKDIQAEQYESISSTISSLPPLKKMIFLEQLFSTIGIKKQKYIDKNIIDSLIIEINKNNLESIKTLYLYEKILAKASYAVSTLCLNHKYEKKLNKKIDELENRRLAISEEHQEYKDREMHKELLNLIKITIKYKIKSLPICSYSNLTLKDNGLFDSLFYTTILKDLNKSKKNIFENIDNSFFDFKKSVNSFHEQAEEFQFIACSPWQDPDMIWMEINKRVAKTLNIPIQALW
ncbi:MAG: hypothetical protein NT124_05100 [Candidatus Dependentiae bacterium]|nr:hypothetical protein [Candidatus Dependentiae bacterium]